MYFLFFKQVSDESIHLLRTEDFKTMADARLLVEKYRVGKRAADLAQMVAAVRGKKKVNTAEKKVSKYNIS